MQQRVVSAKNTGDPVALKMLAGRGDGVEFALGPQYPAS
jgi:hypothetical protein